MLKIRITGSIQEIKDFKYELTKIAEFQSNDKFYENRVSNEMRSYIDIKSLHKLVPLSANKKRLILNEKLNILNKYKDEFSFDLEEIDGNRLYNVLDTIEEILELLVSDVNENE